MYLQNTGFVGDPFLSTSIEQGRKLTKILLLRNFQNEISLSSSSKEPPGKKGPFLETHWPTSGRLSSLSCFPFYPPHQSDANPWCL